MNLYEMPFGQFVGVNNHFQSVLFGGVLMTDETTESFRWVFREFVNLMGGKAPPTVLTGLIFAFRICDIHIINLLRLKKWYLFVGVRINAARGRLQLQARAREEDGPPEELRILFLCPRSLSRMLPTYYSRN